MKSPEARLISPAFLVKSQLIKIFIFGWFIICGFLFKPGDICVYK